MLIKKFTLAISLSLFLPCAFASPQEPFAIIEKALEQGVTTEAEISGPMADLLKAQTRSSSTPKLKAEKFSNLGVCSVVQLTLTIPNVPAKSGELLGDYVAVSKLTLCPDGKLPAGVKGQEIVSCKIGNKPCNEFGF